MAVVGFAFGVALVKASKLAHDDAPDPALWPTPKEALEGRRTTKQRRGDSRDRGDHNRGGDSSGGGGGQTGGDREKGGGGGPTTAAWWKRGRSVLWHSPGSLARRKIWNTAGYKRVSHVFEGMCV